MSDEQSAQPEQAPASQVPPIVVIGAGHNGLVAALKLAKSGHKVVVLERRPVAGGLAAGEEFHPGYRHSGLLHETDQVRAEVLAELGVGVELAVPEPVLVPQVEGPGLVLGPDGPRGALSAGDVESHGRWVAFVGRIKGLVTQLMGAPAPAIDSRANLWELARLGLDARALGPKLVTELSRVVPSTAQDWTGEWFESDLLRAALLGPAMAGTWMGPRSPGSTAPLLLRACTLGRQVVGGPSALVDALLAACESAGVDLRLGACVSRIEVQGGKVTGVTVGDETIGAKRVLACCDPGTALLELVHPMHLHPGMERDIQCWRTRGDLAKVHLALSGPLAFPGHEGAVRVRTGEHPDDFERAHDAVKYRVLPEHPPLDIRLLVGPPFAPEGHAVASILVHGVGYALDAGWGQERNEQLLEIVLSELSRYSPDVRALVVGSEVISPADIEARYGTRGGHVFHGEHALDQLWISRPSLKLARHRTAIEGLFLGSSGTHSGGGITCGPGALAARAVLGG